MVVRRWPAGGLGFSISLPKEVSQAVDVAQQAVSTAQQGVQTAQQGVQTAQQAVSTVQGVAKSGGAPAPRPPVVVSLPKPKPFSEKLKDYAVPIAAVVALAAFGAYVYTRHRRSR